MELARLLPNTAAAPKLRHWRGPHGEEVDIVLEGRAGRVIGIEIKSGATVRHSDLRGISKLKELAGERFLAGLVLCTTRQTVPLAGSSGRFRWRRCGTDRRTALELQLHAREVAGLNRAGVHPITEASCRS